MTCPHSVGRLANGEPRACGLPVHVPLEGICAKHVRERNELLDRVRRTKQRRVVAESLPLEIGASVAPNQPEIGPKRGQK